MTHLIQQVPGAYLPLGVSLRTDRDGAPRLTRDGLQQYEVEVVHREVGSSSEVIKVVVAGAEPQVTPMQPTLFTNLRVDQYVINDTNCTNAGLYFRADGVEPVAGVRRSE